MFLKINKSRNMMVSLVSFIVVVYPLIFGYRSIFPLITFGEVIALPIAFIAVILKKGKIINEGAIICVIAYVVIRVSVSSFGFENYADSFGTGMRLALLYCFIIVLKPYFDEKQGKKYIEIVGILVSVYAIIQIIAARFDVYLTASLPLLTSIRDVDGEVLQKAMYGIRFRPTSILGEPAELGGYLALPLAINLFDDKREKGWIGKSIFFSIAIALTMSSTGIVLLLLEWAIYVFKSKNVRNQHFIVLTLVVGGGVVFFASGLWKYFIDRTFGSYGGQGIKGILLNTHFRDIAGVYAENTGLFEVLFGNGMAEPPGFLPGIFRLYYYFGLFGITLFIYMLFNIYNKNNNSMQKLLMIVWLVMNLGGAYILGSFALPFFMFLSSSGDANMADYVVGTERSQYKRVLSSV